MIPWIILGLAVFEFHLGLFIGYTIWGRKKH